MNATSRTDATPEIVPGRRLDRTFVERLADERGWRTSQEIATGLGINRAQVTVDDLFPAEPAA
jgi:hypothetical protein